MRLQWIITVLLLLGLMIIGYVNLDPIPHAVRRLVEARTAHYVSMGNRIPRIEYREDNGAYIASVWVCGTQRGGCKILHYLITVKQGEPEIQNTTDRH